MDQEFYFLVYDRIITTLTCIITLTLWNNGELQVQKGLYINQGPYIIFVLTEIYMCVVGERGLKYKYVDIWIALSICSHSTKLWYIISCEDFLTCTYFRD